jgi:hypothetical protein
MSIPTAGATPFGTGAHGELLAPRRAQHTEDVLAIHAPPPPPWLVSRKPSELERHDAQLHEPQPQHANVGSPPPIPGPSPQRVPAASRSNPLNAGWPTSAPLAQSYGKPKPFVFDQPPPFMFPKGAAAAARRPVGDSHLLHVPMLLPHSGRRGEGTSAIHSPEARTPPPPPAAEAPESLGSARVSARQSAAPTTSPPPPPGAGASPSTHPSAQEDNRVEAPTGGGSLQRQTTAVTASGQTTEPAQRPRGPTSRPTSFHQQTQQQSPAAAEPPTDGSRAAAAPARTSTFRPKTAPRPRTEATVAPPAAGLDSQPGSFTSAASFTTGPSSPSFYNGPSNQQTGPAASGRNRAAGCRSGRRVTGITISVYSKWRTPAPAVRIRAEETTRRSHRATPPTPSC